MSVFTQDGTGEKMINFRPLDVQKQAAPSRLFFVVQSCLADAYFVVLSN